MMVAHGVVVTEEMVRNQDMQTVWVWDMRGESRIFDLPNGRIGFPLTEVGNTAGGVEFQGKDWSYVLDMFEIPVSHPSEDIRQAVGYGILWHLRERLSGEISMSKCV